MHFLRVIDKKHTIQRDKPNISVLVDFEYNLWEGRMWGNAERVGLEYGCFGYIVYQLERCGRRSGRGKERGVHGFVEENAEYKWEEED